MDWESEARRLANLLMSEYVFVHEKIIEEVDKALEAYIGGSREESKPNKTYDNPPAPIIPREPTSLNVRSGND